MVGVPESLSEVQADPATERYWNYGGVPVVPVCSSVITVQPANSDRSSPWPVHWPVVQDVRRTFEEFPHPREYLKAVAEFWTADPGLPRASMDQWRRWREHPKGREVFDFNVLTSSVNWAYFVDHPDEALGAVNDYQEKSKKVRFVIHFTALKK